MSIADYFDVVFDGPPGPVPGRFVEAEDPDGRSINVGEWVHRPDGNWVLRIKSSRPDLADIALLCDHGAVLCARCDFIPPSWKPERLS